MLQYVADIGRAVQGLGMVVENQNPLFRLAVQHWPITALIVGAWGFQIHRRWKAKELTIYTGLIDSGAILGPAVALMLMAQLARQTPSYPQ
jgi:hypothetical protein